MKSDQLVLRYYHNTKKSRLKLLLLIVVDIHLFTRFASFEYTASSNPFLRIYSHQRVKTWQHGLFWLFDLIQHALLLLLQPLESPGCFLLLSNGVEQFLFIIFLREADSRAIELFHSRVSLTLKLSYLLNSLLILAQINIPQLIS